MTQNRPRRRYGWERLRGGCGGVWKHNSGWIVKHCGHPTALWPYYGLSPDGEMLVSPNGRGFQLLVLAQEAVEAKLRSCHPMKGGG